MFFHLRNTCSDCQNFPTASYIHHVLDNRVLISRRNCDRIAPIDGGYIGGKEPSTKKVAIISTKSRVQLAAGKSETARRFLPPRRIARKLLSFVSSRRVSTPRINRHPPHHRNHLLRSSHFLHSSRINFWDACCSSYSAFVIENGFTQYWGSLLHRTIDCLNTLATFAKYMIATSCSFYI